MLVVPAAHVDLDMQALGHTAEAWEAEVVARSLQESDKGCDGHHLDYRQIQTEVMAHNFDLAPGVDMRQAQEYIGIVKPQVALEVQAADHKYYTVVHLH